MPRHFQFSLRTLLVLTFGIACFFGGMSLQKDLDRRRWEYVGKGFWSPDGGQSQYELEPKELLELGLWDEDDMPDDEIPEPPAVPDDFVPPPPHPDHE